jgi:hypothetical protein
MRTREGEGGLRAPLLVAVLVLELPGVAAQRDVAADLGSGHTVASEKETPNILVNLV